MIEKIEVRTLFGKQLTLQMQDSDNGLFIKELEGLDPTKANIVTTSFAGRDGVQRQASRREARYPKIKLGFDPGAGLSVSSLRDELYKLFMTKMQITLRYFRTDGLVVDVEGEIEDFVSPRNTQDPDATIHIFCFDPDFKGIVTKVANGQTVTGEDAEGRILDYAGTVETGFLFKMTVPYNVPVFSLTNIPGDNNARVLDFNYPMQAGDLIEISTVTGDKGAWVTRGGQRKSALNGVSAISDWVNLYQGENLISVFMEGAPVNFTIEYTDKYGGI